MNIVSNYARLLSKTATVEMKSIMSVRGHCVVDIFFIIVSSAAMFFPLVFMGDGWHKLTIEIFS